MTLCHNLQPPSGLHMNFTIVSSVFLRKYLCLFLKGIGTQGEEETKGEGEKFYLLIDWLDTSRTKLKSRTQNCMWFPHIDRIPSA